MVFRCYVEKRPGFDGSAKGLCRDLREQLGLKGLTGIREWKRYDVEGLGREDYRRAQGIVFAEPQVDDVTEEALPQVEGPHALLAVESLPGQFDQRADSAAQCLQMLTGGERPRVRCATVYALLGQVSAEELERAKKYLINPVESREASADKPQTLAQSYPEAPDVKTVEGFTAMDEGALKALLTDMGLAMDLDDLRFLQSYFRDEEGREPTVTEIRVVDTYWSDHCRHTTFSTHLEDISLADWNVRAAYERYLAAREEVYGERAKTRPQTLMDIATIGTKVLKKRGQLPELDESEEINACSIHVPAVVDGVEQDWLLMFKNETHNHPTEIEPFGGAATCIGGCIRDPLSGRAYVHQAMRITGCGDPRAPISKTLPGKLPQRKLCQTAAAGYSSYGNQIGLATGLVDEMYHEGYIAKHLECGAVVGAAPLDHVRRERPAPGDVVILLGGRTGRDGIGGATGSSKSHDLKSLDTMASEVQKGNAPEERKIQRLFRDGSVTRLIKRCNDFGAGGVSVAIGELADGLEIDLDAVRKKYDGLDGTELAISESQERMAVVVAPEDAAALIAAAERENLEAYPVAVVTQSPRMVMTWRGKVIADLSREFLNTNGAVKTAKVHVPGTTWDERMNAENARRFGGLREMAASLRCASRRGLAERFDGSIGAGSVLMPFGGKYQRTPAQAMAALFPVEPGEETDQASVMAYGCDPETLSVSPYGGAFRAVSVSIAKLVAAGADYKKAYLTLQEFFEKLRTDPERWGKPFAALLGAMDAQLAYGCAAIGGKDSMSGSFLDLDVPPTLISFAIAPIKAGEVISPEFKEPEHPVYYFGRASDEAEQKYVWESVHKLAQRGKVKAAWANEHGIAEGIMKMSFGNKIGFRMEKDLGPGASLDLFADGGAGGILVELSEEIEDAELPATLLGYTTAQPVIDLGEDSAPIDELLALNESVLEDVYPNRAGESGAVEPISWTQRAPVVAKHRIARPKAVIPVFPGTNCELDTARACLRAGIDPEVLVIRNGSAGALAESVSALAAAIGKAQMVALPGGFSGGDEPDGSAKFICSLFRNAAVTDAVHDLLKNRDGLMLGICNGFQALVKLGLIQYGEIRPTDETCPTLTFNLIGRHQSRYVTTRVASVNSPWMLKSQVGDLHAIAISHGEGRFVCSPAVLATLVAQGQVATQYVSPEGVPSMDIDVNPNGSVAAIEGVFSPDGRVFGKMGHSERRGPFVGRNIAGEKDQPIFESGAAYFA